jgi:hypothetical protein
MGHQKMPTLCSIAIVMAPISAPASSSSILRRAWRSRLAGGDAGEFG